MSRVRPYINCKRCAFRYSDYNKGGVYIIYRNDEIEYIGMGSNVYKAFYRHFQSWNDDSCVRHTWDRCDESITAELYVSDSYEDLEKFLIQRLEPNVNLERYKWWNPDKVLSADVLQELEEFLSVVEPVAPF